MRALLLAAACGVAAGEVFIPASDSRIWYSGRTQVNADGSRTFDWEGVQIFININASSYVKAYFNSSGPVTRIRSYVDGTESATVYVGNAYNGQGYYVAMGLGGGELHTIRLYNLIEPSFMNSGAGPGITFAGFGLDGTAQAPSAPLARNIEFVGDSITVGFGAAHTGPCDANLINNDNSLTYGNYLCGNFSANCTWVAWSGKGMYENCCDAGERMPAYYLQTLGAGDYTTDWDFTRFIPDAMLINLGTNDFGHDSGPAWEANFTATYVQFMVNATLKYNNPKLPIFVAQGPMNDSPNLENALQAAIANATALGLSAHYLDMRGPPTDGCEGHPGPLGHRAMFEMAQPQIAAVMGW